MDELGELVHLPRDARVEQVRHPLRLGGLVLLVGWGLGGLVGLAPGGGSKCMTQRHDQNKNTRTQMDAP